MLLIVRFLLKCVLIVCMLIAVVIVCAIDLKPDTPLSWQPNLRLAREIFNKASEQTKTKQDLTFNELELNHLANSLLNRYLNSMTHIELAADNHAIVHGSLEMPERLYAVCLNVKFELFNEGKGLVLRNLYIGLLPIPQVITDRVLDHLLHHSFLRHYYRLGLQHIQAIQINHQQVVASYALNANATGLASSATLDPKVLAYYQEQLELIAMQHDPHWRLSLADLFSPLFKLAYKRSNLSGAVMENIAVIYAVSAYVNHSETPFYLTLKRPDSQTRPLPVYLFKRTDQAKHFMLAAVLTTTGGIQLADMLGQEKELRDAQLTTGFSFIDLAADRAGMRFSEMATRSQDAARALQHKMSDVQDYHAFMPDVQDLPEKLSQAEFTRRYDAFGSKAYKAQLQEIDDRIKALPIYH